VPEANAEQRYFTGEMANQVDADSGFTRGAGPGGDYNAVRPHRLHIGYRNLVIAADLNLSSQFPKVLNQVIGKRIVVIQHENQERSLSSIGYLYGYLYRLPQSRHSARTGGPLSVKTKSSSDRRIEAYLHDGGIDRNVVIHDIE
jgi:hypothetical protein